MPEDEFWECYPKGRGTECRRRRKDMGPYYQNQRDVFFGNSNYRIKVDPQTEYTDWRRYSYAKHFSTHDWLANIPLKTIIDTPELNAMWNRLEPNFWTKAIGINPDTREEMSRIELLLYATAGPDYRKTINYDGLYCPFEKGTHRVIFDGTDIFRALSGIDENTKKPYSKNAVDCTKYLETKVIDLFKKGIRKRLNGDHLEGEDLFNLSVFYLGLIIHYIGDCACFTHSITKDVTIFSDSFMLSNRHFRRKVSERTDLRVGFGKKTLNNPYKKDNLYYFFDIDLNKVDKFKTLDVYSAAYKVAFRTCYNSDNISKIGEFTSTYLIENYKDIMKKSWNKFNLNWQRDNVNHPAYNYLISIQNTLEYAIMNIIWFLNGILKQIIKYSEGVYSFRVKKSFGVIMEKQNIHLTAELKTAFQYFYAKVREYYDKKGSSEKIDYLDICEYISGHLSNNADLIDLEWYRNERDLGGFSKKVNGKVYAYCQDKVLNEGKHFIPEDEPLLQ